MKIIDLPDYAKKFKTKGYDVKKVGNEYYQYKVEHHRVKDKNYPVTRFIYIGKIDKDKGLIVSYTQKDEDIEAYLEYGLSKFIFSHYKRFLQRSLFNITGEFADNIIKLGIIKYIFGSINIMSLKSSFLTYNQAEALQNLYLSNPQNEVKTKTISNKINKLLASAFKDTNDRNIVILSLRNMNVILTKTNQKINTILSSEVKSIMEKCGVKYE